MPPGSHALYVRGMRTNLGRWVRTGYWQPRLGVKHALFVRDLLQSWYLRRPPPPCAAAAIAEDPCMDEPCFDCYGPLIALLRVEIAALQAAPDPNPNPNPDPNPNPNPNPNPSRYPLPSPRPSPSPNPSPNSRSTS